MSCRHPARKARGFCGSLRVTRRNRENPGRRPFVRERWKEPAVTMDVGEAFVVVTHVYSDLTVHLALFPVAIREGMPQNLKHNDICRIAVIKIGWHGFCPADETILARLKYGCKNI